MNQLPRVHWFEAAALSLPFSLKDSPGIEGSPKACYCRLRYVGIANVPEVLSCPFLVQRCQQPLQRLASRLVCRGESTHSKPQHRAFHCFTGHFTNQASLVPRVQSGVLTAFFHTLESESPAPTLGGNILIWPYKHVCPYLGLMADIGSKICSRQ